MLDAGRRHGRLRLHGRGPLPGVAHRRAVLRPAAAAGPGGALRPRPTASRAPRRSAGLAVASRPTGRRCSPATTCSWSTSARPATRTPRSRSPRWTPASTCCARSRWPTPSTRRRAMVAAAERGAGRGRAQHGRLQLPAGAGGGARPAAGRAGPDRRDPPRPRGVPAGLDRRPGVPAGLAAAEGQGRVGRAGRHRRAHRRHGPVRHRRPARRASRALTETFVKERPLPAASSGLSASGSSEPDAATVDRRRRGAVPRPVRRRGGGHVRGHPVRHRPQERAAAGGQRQRRVARVRLRVDERAVVLRRHRGPRHRRVPPDPRHRARPTRTPARGGRRATGSATSTRSPTRWSTWSATSPRAPTRRRRSPTGCRSSRCWTP